MQNSELKIQEQGPPEKTKNKTKNKKKNKKPERKQKESPSIADPVAYLQQTPQPNPENLTESRMNFGSVVICNCCTNDEFIAEDEPGDNGELKLNRLELDGATQSVPSEQDAAVGLCLLCASGPRVGLLEPCNHAAIHKVRAQK
jgi:hypothetical protein